VPAVWDAPSDWSGFDLVVVRSTWDYAERRDAFLAWAESLPEVWNAAPVLRWSTDKELYLSDLERAGVPVVPTRFLPPGTGFGPPGGPFVVKPAVSAGGRRSGRFAPEEAGAAAKLVEAIHAAGGTAMVQPYLGPAELIGELGLVYLEGSYSHAVRRSVPLPAPDGPGTTLYLAESVTAAQPSAAALELAGRTLAAVPFGPLLYARVDLVNGPGGAPLVLELELAEPSLYLSADTGATERFAAAIERAAAASQRRRISADNGPTTRQ